MKKILITLATIFVALGANAINFGLRGGLMVNSLKIKMDQQGLKEAFNDKLGWQVGVIVEVPLPLGLAVDGSVMYNHHKLDVLDAGGKYYNRSTIGIPINLKYKLNIVGVDRIIKPMVYTGPEFGILLSKDTFKFNNISGTFKHFNTNWNVGFGVELFNHLQITATYCMGLNKSLKASYEDIIDGKTVTSLVKGSDRYWTVTAAYMF